MSVLDRLIGVVAPFECLGCSAEGGMLCAICTASLPRTSKLLINGLTVQAVTTYSGLAKTVVWRLKLSGARVAATVVAQSIAARSQFPSEAYIVPVPTATGRVRRRGYDQAGLIARHLSKQTGLPLLNCLVRTGQTHQHGSSSDQRRRNLIKAFYVRKPHIQADRPIILIDDVMTTGATLEAAAQALRERGAKQIEAMVFARALPSLK